MKPRAGAGGGKWGWVGTDRLKSLRNITQMAGANTQKPQQLPQHKCNRIYLFSS